MIFSIFADGGARGNPGPSGAGAVVRDEKGKTVAEVSKFLGHKTNNFAEYEAVISAFDELLALLSEADLADTEVNVFMDSELVVKQMNGLYKVKHPVLKMQQARLKENISKFGHVSFSHVRREKNKDADALANKAMDRGE